MPNVPIAIKTPINNIIIDLFLLIIFSPTLLGFLFIIPGSAGSTLKAVAGNKSVARLIRKIDGIKRIKRAYK